MPTINTVKQLLELLPETVYKGQRRRTIQEVAYRLYDMGIGDIDTITGIASGINATRCSPKLTENRVYKTAKEALHYRKSTRFAAYYPLGEFGKRLREMGY
jgi:hypothetical protein